MAAVVPYLSYRDAAAALAFLTEAFGFRVTTRWDDAGATVVFAPEDTEWGTRRARVLDLEGYEWSVGSYRPGAPAG